MNLRALALVGSFATLGGVTEASATILTYTFTGTISSQVDSLNLFGGNLVGQTYTDVETFDFGQMPVETMSAGVTFYEGGSSFGTPVFGTSTLTVGSFTETSTGTLDSELAINPNVSLVTQIRPYSYYNEGNFASETDEHVESAMVGNGMMPGTIIPTFGFGSYGVEAGGTAGTTSNLILVPTQLVISLSSGVSAVPLPSSAPMFGLALVVLGAVGYSVKRKKEAAAA